MSKEIERKFLLPSLPAFVKQSKSVDIEQGYLALSDEDNEVRLRKADNRYFLTVKSSGSMIRDEYEIEIPAGHFTKLWPATKGRRLQKRRYFYTEKGIDYEIDIYHPPLSGLIVAEIEFPDKNQAKAFVAPSWLGKEITHLNAAKNKNLIKLKRTPDY